MRIVNLNMPDSRLLRMALQGNALFSFSSGLLMLGAAQYIATLLGEVSPLVVTVTGAGLVVFAIWLFFMARADSVSVSDVWSVIAGDVVWVLASIVLMLGFTSIFTGPGLWLLGGIALIVFTFADLQFFGLKRSMTS